ncbi:hypothetical protein [Halobellus sp. H-GB7]|uniref:hypothetical protein n=1 Tax=Halobellus sp. H-GB7 TaxID=3069756 RepID=UPI0027B00A95|nr:hypothetical protein [Halobellus sp. H-GB7]MDQ2054433.1 hypothetical protein [Halobellus sp. H-GB7]
MTFNRKERSEDMYPTTCFSERIGGIQRLESKGTVPGDNFGPVHGGTKDEP